MESPSERLLRKAEEVHETGPQGSSRLFHTFKQWLKNDASHRQGEYCEDDGCGTCSEWLLIAWEKCGRRNELQDAGFDKGRQIAEDILITLAVMTPYEPLNKKEQEVFSAAVLQGFETTLRRDLPDFQENSE